MGTAARRCKGDLHEGLLAFGRDPRENIVMAQGRKQARGAAVPASGRSARGPKAPPAPPLRPLRAAGRSPAPALRRSGMTRQPPGRHRFVSPTLIFGGMALALVVVVALLGWHWAFDPLPTYVAAISVATFVLYAYDKAVAGRGRLRIPESVLHGVALLGGTVAALVAQRLFRHKVSKAAFQRVFVTTGVIQLALLGAWIWWRRRG